MSESTPNLERLQRATSGDQAALEELLLEHYDRLIFRLSGKIPTQLQGTLTAEDVLQETFLDVINRIATFEPRSEEAFFHWVATIAEHRLIDMIRAQKAAKRGGDRAQVDNAAGEAESVADLLGLLAVNERTPSRSAAGHEAVDAIRGALEQIKPDYREALRLRYVEGLSVADTAARMDRTEPAIHMLCHRGLLSLRDTLGSDSQFFSRKA